MKKRHGIISLIVLPAMFLLGGCFSSDSMIKVKDKKEDSKA